ncbi:MAG: HDIG domain-containing protein [Chloroflexota bacterium]|nr:MAG: HDIG domain-containing protein [Chloroflexota bacterium]
MKTIKQPPFDLTERWLDSYPLLQKVIYVLQTHRLEAYLVGGAVRDMLLGRESIVDLDFVVPGDGLAVARRVANALDAAYYPLDAERGTGRVVVEKSYLDFASLRGATLLDDLADRDFTINAIALSLVEPFQLIDPLGGQADLEAGQIRAASATAFSHDPVRVLRAVRQAVEFGFSLEAGTEAALHDAVPGLPAISPERQRDELLKLLNTPAPGQAVQMLRRLGVLPHILPEIESLIGVTQGPPHYLDVFDHTTAALDAWARLVQSSFADLPAQLQAAVVQELNEPLAGNLTQQTLLPLALLLHDTGKPSTREPAPDSAAVHFYRHERVGAKITGKVMRRFRFSNQAANFVETVVARHMRPLLLMMEWRVSRRAVYRFFRDTAGSGYQAGVAVALHALADHDATYPPGQGEQELRELREVVYKLVAAYFEQREQVVEPAPLLTGRDLMDTLGLPEGRLIGILLNRLKEAQATGEVTDRAAALAFIQADPDFPHGRRPPTDDHPV